MARNALDSPVKRPAEAAGAEAGVPGPCGGGGPFTPLASRTRGPLATAKVTSGAGPAEPDHRIRPDGDAARTADTSREPPVPANGLPGAAARVGGTRHRAGGVHRSPFPHW